MQADNHIKKVKAHEFERVREIFHLGIALMHHDGIFQWDAEYPSPELLASDIVQESMHGFYLDEKLAGLIVLNHHQEPAYQSIEWEFDDPNPLVIHRICIDPDYISRGIALKLMHFAIEYAIQENHLSMRLDTFEGNFKAQALFTKIGFTKLGTVSFRNRQFFCYEKILSGQATT